MIFSYDVKKLRVSTRAMPIQSIDDFKDAVERLLDVLARNIDDDYYPRNGYGEVLTFAKWKLVTFDFPKGDATPFIEMRNGQFHFVISERGYESKRAIGNADEVLALLLDGITFTLASGFAARHSVKGQDFRRALFTKQIELLTLLNPEWAQSVSEKQRAILQEFPFSDNS